MLTLKCNYSAQTNHQPDPECKQLQTKLTAVTSSQFPKIQQFDGGA